MTDLSNLVFRSARDIVDLLRVEEITPHDLLDAVAQRIERVEARVNALPTLCFDRAREAADRMMRKPVGERGLLCGLPVPIKDLSAVSGVRTTYGSRVHAGLVPETTDISPARLEDNGAIIYAKSNTPEFGAGGHTVNDVFGLTRNPWNLARSAGGSSGGAAAALASHTAWLAQGSDLAGSLRTPAAFCGVVGLRPTPGRVAFGPLKDPFDTLSVHGPMARDVVDAALLLDAMAGEHDRAPLSLAQPPASFLAHALRPRLPRLLAYSEGLGVAQPEPGIAAICGAAMERLSASGVTVEQPRVDLSASARAFLVLRGVSYAVNHSDALARHRALLNDNVVRNIEYGQSLESHQIIEARRWVGQSFHEVAALLDRYEVIICPSTIVEAFPAEQDYVTQVAGRTFGTYIDWLSITYALTPLGLPVISIPCGITTAGLPVGIQIVGRARAEASLLSVASAIEAVIGRLALPISRDEPEHQARG